MTWKFTENFSGIYVWHPVFHHKYFMLQKSELVKTFSNNVVSAMSALVWVNACLLDDSNPWKTYYFALFKNPFSFISRSPSSCWDTLLAHEAKWHFQPKLVIWSKYYFHSLKTLIGDLKYYFPILYLCLFLRPVMIFPQGKLLSCLRKFWVNSWKLRRTYIFHI